MKLYRTRVAEDLAANYSATDGTQLQPRILQALLRTHRDIVDREERARCKPWSAACRIAILEHLPYHGQGDDTEERDKPKQLLRPSALPPKRKPKLKPQKKSQTRVVTVALTKPQALLLARSAVEALERGFVDKQTHRTLQRALAVVREATPPAKETP